MRGRISRIESDRLNKIGNCELESTRYQVALAARAPDRRGVFRRQGPFQGPVKIRDRRRMIAFCFQGKTAIRKKVPAQPDRFAEVRNGSIQFADTSPGLASGGKGVRGA